jgi:hypothetical protein
MAHKSAKNSFRLTIENTLIFTEIEVLNLPSPTNADATTQ